MTLTSYLITLGKLFRILGEPLLFFVLASWFLSLLREEVNNYGVTAYIVYRANNLIKYRRLGAIGCCSEMYAITFYLLLLQALCFTNNLLKLQWRNRYCNCAKNCVISVAYQLSFRLSRSPSQTGKQTCFCTLHWITGAESKQSQWVE